jgi:AcrR family transcriptional regulator
MKKELQKVRVPQQKRGIATKNSIMAAAELLFSKKGYHGTNAKEIAGEAGVSVGSFYSYFKDKKALFLEVFVNHLEESVLKILSEEKVESADEKNRKAMVYSLIKRMLDSHDMSPEFHREAAAMRYSDPEVDRFFDEFDKKSVNHLAEHLKLFEGKLRVDDIQAAAVVVCGATEAVIHSIKMFKPMLEEDRLLNELSDMIHRYLFK